jgi:hypothetical protein
VLKELGLAMRELGTELEKRGYTFNVQELADLYGVTLEEASEALRAAAKAAGNDNGNRPTDDKQPAEPEPAAKPVAA